MKKTITVSILLLLVLSILPVAFALDLGLDTSTRGNVELENRSIQTDVTAEARTQGRERLKDMKENLKEKREEMREKKELRKEMMNDLKERRKELMEAKDVLLKTRTEMKGCKGKEDGTCKQLRMDLKKNSKEYILKTLDKTTELLTEFNKKIESSALELDLKTKLKTRIDSELNTLVTLKTNVNSLNENSRNEDFKKIVKDVKDEWNKAHDVLKIMNGIVVTSKTGLIIERAERLELKLTTLLEKLQTQGKDTATLKTLIDAFNTHIKNAKEKRLKSLELLLDLSGSTDLSFKKENIQETHTLLREAQTELKEAHTTLKEILKLVKTDKKVTPETEIETSTKGVNVNEDVQAKAEV